jgi:hypothetical protein
MDDTHDVSESFPRILNPGKKNSSAETEFSRVIDFLQLIAFVSACESGARRLRNDGSEPSQRKETEH